MLEKIRNVTLVEQAANQLTAYIERENLRPGDQLPSIQDLVGTLYVSRPVIREALKSLEARGIIQIANGRRAVIAPVSNELLLDFFQRVAKLDQESVGDFMEIRLGLETHGARLAAMRRTASQLSAMKAVIEDMRHNLGDIDAFTRQDVKFHLLIAQATHNSLMAHLVESISQTMRVTMWEGRRRRLTAEQLTRVQVLHEAILTAIERQNADGAANAMEQHFDEIAMSIGKQELIERAGYGSADHERPNQDGST